MIIKAWVFDRIEQTFFLFKDNFVWLFLPIFLYNFISVVVFWTITKYYIITNIASIENIEWLDLFAFLNNPKVALIIITTVFLFIVYLLLYIVILLWFIKSVKQVAYGEKINILENIKYWITRFFSSMKTYWYIFSYVALFPAIIFIAWWILFNTWLYFWDLYLLKQIGLILMWVSVFIFIIFAIYRWIKTSFSIYLATDKDCFTKEKFNNSLEITNEKWWRILWNFLLIGLLVSLVTSIIWWIIWIISFVGWGWISLLEWFITWFQSQDPEVIVSLFKEYISIFSLSWEILWNTIDNILNTISSVFILTFTYLFYKRLEGEKNGINKDFFEEKKIEL